MDFKNRLLKHERDDLHAPISTFISNSENEKLRTLKLLKITACNNVKWRVYIKMYTLPDTH